MQTTLHMFNLSVCLDIEDPQLVKFVASFLDKFYTVHQQGYSPKLPGTTTMFASRVRKSGVFFIYNRQFVHLHHYAKEAGVNLKIETKEDHRDYLVKTTDYKVRPEWRLREGQIPVSEFLLEKQSGSKLVPLATGSGKTATFLITAGTMKKRFAIVLLPFLMEKWVEDIVEVHDAVSTDVLVVKGFKQLAALINIAKENSGVDCDYFMFSNRTMQDFVKAYENDPESCIELYGCSPVELFPLLQVGVLLVDEVHMSFHSVFKTLVHSNVEYHIGMTATLVSEDPVISRMHKVVYSKDDVYGDTMIKRYMDMYPTIYDIDQDSMRFIKTSNYGSTSYSHTAYEQSILKHGRMLDAYFKMIETVAEEHYVQHYLPKDKLIIFVSTVKMATLLSERLAETYPDKVVTRYCEQDDYDDLITAEVIVTTVMSAGTGVDIPNLRVAIQTVNISSIASNIQSAGRLRELKDRDVKFCYLYCNNIPKHHEYHKKRLDIFKNRVASVNLRRSRVNLR